MSRSDREQELTSLGCVVLEYINNVPTYKLLAQGVCAADGVAEAMAVGTLPREEFNYELLRDIVLAERLAVALYSCTTTCLWLLTNAPAEIEAPDERWAATIDEIRDAFDQLKQTVTIIEDAEADHKSEHLPLN